MQREGRLEGYFLCRIVDAISPPEGIETLQDLYKSLQVSKKRQPSRMMHGNDLHGGKKAIRNPQPSAAHAGLIFLPVLRTSDAAFWQPQTRLPNQSAAACRNKKTPPVHSHLQGCGPAVFLAIYKQ